MKNKVKIINSLLIFLVITISCLIFKNKIVNLSFLENIFLSMVNHTNIKQDEINVSNSQNFIKINDNTYTNNSYCVYSPFKATVIDINDSSIILKSKDNIYIFFEDVININVKKLDYVSCDDILANFIECYKLYFFQEGKSLTYEEISRNN